MASQDLSPLEHRQARDHEQHVTENLDHIDASSTLLPKKVRTRPVSSLSSVLNGSHKNIPRITAIQIDALKKLDSMTQPARYTRLLIFVALELLWLGFALLCHFYVIKTSSVWSIVSITSGFVSVNRDTLLKSGLSTIAITIQLIALLPVTAIIVEIYSSEWAHVLSRSSGRLTQSTDRVSTLTSSFLDRSAHLLSKHAHASTRFRLAFVAGILLLLLQALAPGALIISSDVVRVDTRLIIGALAPGMTEDTEPVTFGVGDSTLRARRLAAEAARYEYFTWIRNTTLDFKVSSDGLLFGMPPRELLSSNAHVEYESDGVQFQYECKWLAPTYVTGTILNSTWTFGEGDEGTLDYNAVPASANSIVVYGIWPLMITAGIGSSNGSFAWLFIGGGTGELANTAHMPISLSSIPATQRTYNTSGWKDLLLDNNTRDDYDQETSTDASVLFCDPHMQLATMHVTLRGQQVFAQGTGNGTSVVGNVDAGEASRMLGRSLNGMPWDTVHFEKRGRNAGDGLSELGVTFSLTLTNSSSGLPVLPLVPPPLDVLERSLGEYTTIAGASAYFDGSLGNVSVPAQRYEPIQRLVCSWPQWSASVVLLLLVSILIGTITVRVGSLKESIAIPLSCASVIAAIDPDRAELYEDMTEEEKKPESFKEKGVVGSYSTGM